MLFSERSILTMIHGIVVGGGALMGLAAALFFLYATREPTGSHADESFASRALSGLTALTAALLWLTVIAGTYVLFPPYRATPPPGVTDLTQFPRSLIQSRPDTVWLHAFAMESKEHVPWIASMLATSVAFVSMRYGAKLLRDVQLRRAASAFLAVAFALVAFVSLMGVFVNKVAPLQ